MKAICKVSVGSQWLSGVGGWGFCNEPRANEYSVGFHECNILEELFVLSFHKLMVVISSSSPQKKIYRVSLVSQMCACVRGAVAANHVHMNTP